MKKPIDYEVFGGFIVMELTNNHLNEIMSNIHIINTSKIGMRLNNIVKYLDNESKTEKDF